jgi:hypothetical protein
MNDELINELVTAAAGLAALLVGSTTIREMNDPDLHLTRVVAHLGVLERNMHTVNNAILFLH